MLPSRCRTGARGRRPLANLARGYRRPPAVSHFRPASGSCMIPARRMKRRTLKGHRPDRPSLHHYVYVVLLDPAARRLPSVRAVNPGWRRGQPCVYVGMTGLTPEERFANHKQGIKAAGVVRRHGLRLLPELYVHLNPMPYEAAVAMERDLAEDLRRAGYAVTGGH